VSYFIDTYTDTIRFMTTRLINSEEELCIFYGHQLWFEPVEAAAQANTPTETESTKGVWEGLCVTKEANNMVDDFSPEVIPEDKLPCTRVTLTLDHEEEDLSTIRTGKFYLKVPTSRA
jgi:tRNA-specific adenosine deaminase 3